MKNCRDELHDDLARIPVPAEVRDRLRQRLQHGLEEAGEPTASRPGRPEVVPRGRVGTWGRLGAAAAVSVALLATVATVVSSRGRDQRARGSFLALPGHLALNTREPLVGAKKTTLAAAEVGADFVVPVPHSAVASTRNLSAVWLGSARRVALVFSGGEVSMELAPAAYRHPRQSFETFVSENTARASVQSLGGRPVLVIVPRTDPGRSNPAWVELDWNGVDVNIFSHHYGTRVLLRIAASLADPPAARCSVAQLKVSFFGESGAAGTGLIGIDLANTSSVPCWLHGVPRVSFFGPDGSRLPTTCGYCGRYFPPAVRVLLRHEATVPSSLLPGPATSAGFVIAKRDFPSGASNRCADVSSIAVELPGVLHRYGVRVALRGQNPLCGSPAPIGVSPIMSRLELFSYVVTS